MKPIIAVDMDGVMVSVNPIIVDALNDAEIELPSEHEGVPRQVSYDDITEFDYAKTFGRKGRDIAYAVWEREDLYDDLDPEPDCEDVLEELRKYYRVIAVSSPFVSHAESKLNWLIRRGFMHDDIFLLWDKTLLFPSIDLIVEDKPKTIMAASHAKVPTVVHARPWNKGITDSPFTALAENWLQIWDCINEARAEGLF